MPHVSLAKIRIGNRLRRQLGNCVGHLSGRQFKARRFPIVEVPAVLAHSVHSIGLQVQQHLGNHGRRHWIVFEESMSAGFEYLHGSHSRYLSGASSSTMLLSLGSAARLIV